MLDYQVDLVGDFASKGYLVGDDHAGHAMFREFADGDRRRPSMLERTCDARFSQAGETLYALGDVAPSWTIQEGARMAAGRARPIFR